MFHSFTTKPVNAAVPNHLTFRSLLILVICVYYDMTVAHQYSTLKNETLKYCEMERFGMVLL